MQLYNISKVIEKKPHNHLYWDPKGIWQSSTCLWTLIKVPRDIRNKWSVSQNNKGYLQQTDDQCYSN